MDDHRFDALARSLTDASSRRGLLRGLAATTLGLAATRISGTVAARKNRKKPQLNAFGCLNVGQKCRGNSGLCCSGICQGKKPKNGKPDKSHCVAHDSGDCQANQDSCLVEEDIPCGTNGVCTRTTGRASFCGGGGACTACQKDTDCQALGFGEKAACVVCRSTCPDTITICAELRA